MKRLTVLYDPSCGFCTRCRGWLEAQPAHVELEFVPAGSAEAAQRFPGLTDAGRPGELTVVDDEGGVYRGPEAFLMCLWALVEYQELSHTLASPLLLPFARRFFVLLSTARKPISWLLRMKSEEELLAEVSD